jgi:hypothetical protein
VSEALKLKLELRRWRGAASLLGAAVEQGASAIERVHLATSQRTFTVLEHIPVVSAPVHLIHTVHDAAVSQVYANVRWVTRAVTKTLEVALDVAEQHGPQTPAVQLIPTPTEAPNKMHISAVFNSLAKRSG